MKGLSESEWLQHVNLSRREGSSSVAVEYIRRLLTRPRAASAVLGNPISHHLPWLLLEERNEFPDGVIERLVEDMRPFMRMEDEEVGWADLALMGLRTIGWPRANEPVHEMECGQ